MRRREFLQLAGLGMAGLLAPQALANEQRLLPVPDLDPSQVLRYTAGLRPLRTKSYRLEALSGERMVVHNYGHGGSGFTMAPGCAQLVSEWVQQGPEGPVAVVGGGINGLFCAWRLSEAGRQVTIYADKFSPHTTSDAAGAFWGPASVAISDRAQFNRVLQISIDVYRQTEPAWGVSPIDHYHLEPVEKGFWKEVPPGMLDTRVIDPAPFQAFSGPATVFKTVVISPPIILGCLRGRLTEMGVRFVPRKLANLSELKEPIIVNCSGLGAASLVQDTQMVPIRGQLVHLKPQDLGYSLTRGPYLIPRPDALVLGGTYERGQTTARPNDRDCRRILRSHQLFFGGWLSPFRRSLL